MGEQKAVFKGRSRAKTVFHELSNPGSSEAALPTSGKALHSAIKNNGTCQSIHIVRIYKQPQILIYINVCIYERWISSC
jgi:hypothetical protein